MGLEWKFKAPVLIGDTISLHVKATKKRKIPRLGGGIIFLDASLHNQRGEVVQEGEWRMLVKSQPSI
jgi:acyl dehydratase